MTTPSTPPRAPAPLSVVIREGVTDVACVAAAWHLAVTEVAGWEVLWSAIIIGTIGGVHSVFKAAGKSRGAIVPLLGLGWTAATWAAHKGAFYAAPVASIISRVGKG